MDYKKPQDTLVHGGIGLYPLTTADQVILSDGSRLEKDGKINADKLNGRTLAEIMLALYPVGAVYISANSTSPASLFGGTWESIGGRFLLGADNTYTAGSTGGEATHTLTVGEMPSHDHPAVHAANNYISCWDTPGAGNSQVFDLQSLYIANANDDYNTFVGNNSGGNQPHNNMPPYLAVYMWRRTA